MAEAVATVDEELPRVMRAPVIERHGSERSRLVVLVVEGRCPWCGWGAMRAEAGQRGFCPSCSRPVLAVVAPHDP